jgi:hypothetical protein
MLTQAEQYRQLVDLLENPEQRYIRRMNENVVKPYLQYLSNLNSYLIETQLSTGDLKNIAQQAKSDPGSVVVPAQVQKNFAQELSEIPPGPVDGFNEKINQELQQITDPEIKQSLVQRAREAIKNPDTQQTVLSAVSTITGMIAGAATLGLGTDAAKSATKHLGNGLIAIMNARLAGKSWRDSIKSGASTSAKAAAGDELEIGGAQSGTDAGGGSTAKIAANIDPVQLKSEWEKFVQYGQSLISKITPAKA